jgi:hypothetical protein
LSSVTNKQFAEEMVTAIEPVISFQNDIVVREKTTGDEMFFISSGVVEIFLAGAQNTTYVAIGDGCVSNRSEKVFFFVTDSLH